MSQARRAERERLRAVRQITESMGRQFVQLVSILARTAPTGHPPELFGTLEAMRQVFEFFPVFVANSSEGGVESEKTRVLAVDVVDKVWLAAKQELLEGLEGVESFELTQRVLAWECTAHDHLSTKNPCPTCKRAAEIVDRSQ